MREGHIPQGIDEWGPDCARCGGEEYRINGYCSHHCEDLHEVELERDEYKQAAEAEATLADEGWSEVRRLRDAIEKWKLSFTDSGEIATADLELARALDPANERSP